MDIGTNTVRRAKKRGNIYVVRVIIPWIVRNARTPKDAVNIAIHEVGKRLSDKRLEVCRVSCTCGRGLDAVLFTPGMSMVCVETSVKVVALNESEAGKVAKAIVGKKLRDVPLSIGEVITG
ncbi:DUF555 domain-containing protein [Archaeoglobus neptunius]|uniref:DUF555 domain-containing protein n=1 Tax=Archaeoglobus neptunius TaxID=2798580 RepID=UPI001927F3B3|nr:DUF555 domain-containing protein [Archaeoglobus neptunius]